jgi:hypothetical protein
MIPALLAAFAIYFSVQLCLTSFLLFIDGRAYRNLTGGSYRHGYHCGRILAIAFIVLQIGLAIAGLAGVVVAVRSSRDMCDWIQAGVVCSLQLGASTNVRQLTLCV